jgi:prepilin-type N-terminal cleavage/methylation domain-containing protein
MKRSFTLVELLIVVVIVGVLTTLAVTQYGSVKERTLSREAIANLKLITAAERIYGMEYDGYYPVSTQDDINLNLRLSVNERNWDYAVSTSGGNFTATADRQGTGGYLDCQYTFTDADIAADRDPVPNVSCPH